MTTLMRRNGGITRREGLPGFHRAVAEIDRVLDTALGSLAGPTPGGSWESAFTPLADIEETDDAYVIEIDLPGIAREDATLEVEGRRILVSGDRKDRERPGIFRTKTRVSGRFRYEALLPGAVDAEGVTAAYQDGTLTVRAPKPEPARANVRKIEIR
jgi:HSP20 family protein